MFGVTLVFQELREQYSRSSLGKQIFSRLSFVLLVYLLNACTTSASTSEETQVKTVDPDKTLAQELSADATELAQSYFTSLIIDPTPIEQWEKSDGWVNFYQGRLKEAIQAFNRELKSAEAPFRTSLEVGLVRAHLEAAEAYNELLRAESTLLPLWLSLERGRPHAQLYEAWYNWIELAATSPSTSEHQKRLAQLKKTETMSTWAEYAVSFDSSLPSTPARPKASYRRWLKFKKAVSQGELDQADRHFAKLKKRSPMLTLQGTAEQPPLKVFDPRVSKSLFQYHLAHAQKQCASITLSGYYCGRVNELKGDKQAAILSFKQAITQIDTQSQRVSSHLEHLILSSHLNLESVRREVESRLQQYSVPSSSRKQTDNVNSPSTVASLWHSLSNAKKPLPQLFPERRRALGILASQALQNAAQHEKKKAEAEARIDYIASLGLVERWLDELHYRYACRLVVQDERVRALKVLNASEEAKAGSRVSGRNRLGRLLLSSYNYLKMKQYRVSMKYYQRIKSSLPAITFSLEMTSDILSGKSFEQRGGRTSQGL